MMRIRPLSLSLAMAGLLASSCDSSRTVAPQATAPPATSATGAVKRFEFAFNHRDVATIARLLADDMLFVTAGADSAGSMASEEWSRERFLAALRAMLHGNPDGPPAATRVSLTLDRNLVEFPDTRPGLSSTAHRTVRTSVLLRVDPGEGATYEAAGYLLFFITRGDSAQIPADQPGGASNTRWWIDRIEDKTLGGGLRAMPSSATWFGLILSYYDVWLGPGLHSPRAASKRSS